MKSEKGEVLALAIITVTILIIIAIFMIIVDNIKNSIDYGTKEGTVADKRYHAAYTTMIYSGKVMIPQYHPENWQIKIQKEVNGEIKSIWIDVDEVTYHSLKINDYYPKEE